MNHSETRRDQKSLAGHNAPAKIQGGNWHTHGFRRASELYDEVECRMSIDEFIFEQGLPRVGEFS